MLATCAPSQIGIARPYTLEWQYTAIFPTNPLERAAYPQKDSIGSMALGGVGFGALGAAAEGESGALGTFIARKTAHMCPALRSRDHAAAKSQGFGRGLAYQAQMMLHPTRY